MNDKLARLTAQLAVHFVESAEMACAFRKKLAGLGYVVNAKG